MRIEQINYFLDIAQSQSISRTAEHFFISQQAVSNAMKRLEEEFHCQLLHRSKTGVTLTEAGEMFLQEAERIRDAYNRLQLALNLQYQEQSRLYGHLRIILHPRFYHLGLKAFLREFPNKFPHIKLSFMEGDNLQISEAVQSGQADFGLVFGRINIAGQMEEQPSDIKEKILCRDNVYVGCAAPHPLSDCTEITLYALEEYAVTCFMSNSFVASYNRAKKNIFFCSDFMMQCDFIRNGIAAGVLTDYEYRTFFKKNSQVKKVIIKESSAELILLYPVSKEENPCFSVFINQIVEYYKTWAANNLLLP